jgi:uncharacterized protein YlxW (UPF0749 family)
MAGKTTTWVGGTVFAAVIVLAGSWVFAISPQLAAADEARTEQTVVEDHNTKLQSDLKKLKAQFENLDKYKSEVTALEVQIPGTAQLADYLREVSSLTTASGAFIVGVKPGVPIPVTPGSDTDTTTVGVVRSRRRDVGRRHGSHFARSDGGGHRRIRRGSGRSDAPRHCPERDERT